MQLLEKLFRYFSKLFPIISRKPNNWTHHSYSTKRTWSDQFDKLNPNGCGYFIEFILSFIIFIPILVFAFKLADLSKQIEWLIRIEHIRITHTHLNALINISSDSLIFYAFKFKFKWILNIHLICFVHFFLSIVIN